MRHLLIAAALLATTPAFAGGYVFDLPRLSWPTETDAPTTEAPVAQGCIKPTTVAPTCALSN